MVTRGTDFDTQALSLAERANVAFARVAELGRATGDSQDRREALLLNLERVAWAAIELAKLLAFERRLGAPSAANDTQSFDLLVRAGLLDPALGRRLKQATEYRNLSSRDPRKLDWDYLSGSLEEDMSVLNEWFMLPKDPTQPAST